MHVFSGEPPVARSLAQNLYLVLVGLILVGIVIQGLLIGPSLFAATSFGRAAHGNLGVVIFLLTVLLPVAGRLARQSGRMILLSVALFMLALVEVTSAAFRQKGSVAGRSPSGHRLVDGWSDGAAARARVARGAGEQG